MKMNSSNVNRNKKYLVTFFILFLDMSSHTQAFQLSSQNLYQSNSAPFGTRRTLHPNLQQNDGKNSGILSLNMSASINQDRSGNRIRIRNFITKRLTMFRRRSLKKEKQESTSLSGSLFYRNGDEVDYIPPIIENINVSEETVVENNDATKMAIETLTISEKDREQRELGKSLPSDIYLPSHSNRIIENEMENKIMSVEMFIGRVAMVAAVYLIYGEIMTGSSFPTQLGF